MTSEVGEIQVLNVDRLGIVAGIVDEMSLVEQVMNCGADSVLLLADSSKKSC